MTVTVGRYPKRHPYSFAVHRPHVLGNPFRIGVDGDRAEVIEKFRVWFERRLLDDPVVRYAFDGLTEMARTHDITLICFCHDENGNGEACHADVIAEEIRRRLALTREEASTCHD